MTLQAFCPNCKRKVFIVAGDTPVCPVCVTPLLLDTIEERAESAVKDR